MNLTLVPLNISDADILFEWRNLEYIVKLSSSQKEVTYTEHINWIKKVLSGTDTKIYFITFLGEKIGQVRFDLLDAENTTATISIYLLEKFTGKGYGVQAIQIGSDIIFAEWKNLEKIYSFIREENLNSMKAFQKAGYTEFSSEEIPFAHRGFQFKKALNNNEENIKLYSDLVSTHGINYKSLNWGSKESQQLRFKVLSEIGNLNNKTILDVGCGLGDLYNWFLEKKINIHYIGIDITPKMIEAAKKRFPNISFEVKDIFTDFVEPVDYIFLSGIFTYQNDLFLKAVIARLFEKVKIGLAFNALSIWAEDKDDEFYADPLKTIEYCKSFTPWVTLRHDYHSRDFTIYMHKNRNI